MRSLRRLMLRVLRSYAALRFVAFGAGHGHARGWGPAGDVHGVFSHKSRGKTAQARPHVSLILPAQQCLLG